MAREIKHSHIKVQTKKYLRKKKYFKWVKCCYKMCKNFVFITIKHSKVFI